MGQEGTLELSLPASLYHPLLGNKMTSKAIAAVVDHDLDAEVEEQRENWKVPSPIPTAWFCPSAH